MFEPLLYEVILVPWLLIMVFFNVFGTGDAVFDTVTGLSIVVYIVARYGATYQNDSLENHEILWPWFRSVVGKTVVNKLRTWFRFHVRPPPRQTNPIQPNDRPYVFLFHPHGPLALGMGLLFVATCNLEEMGYKEHVLRRRPLRLAVHWLLLVSPFVKDVMMWLGCIDASRASIEAALARGESVAVCPGGTREMRAVSETPNAPLQDEARPLRLKILGLCYDYGVPTVPIYSPHEEEQFWVVPSRPGTVYHRLRMYIYRKLRYPLTVCCLRWNRPALEIKVGSVLDPLKSASASEFEQSYRSALMALQDSISEEKEEDAIRGR